MDDGIGIVCAVLVLVFLFNLGILLPVLRCGGKRFENPFKEYRPPWEVEQEAVTELHKSLLELDQGSDKETPSQNGR